MEWDQITDRWAAMTHRLRGDVTETLSDMQPSQGDDPVAQKSDPQQSDTLEADALGANPNMPQDQ